MRRVAGLMALALSAMWLAGCVYDPYTGTYAACCGYYGYPSYGYPYYRYPPPTYAPYGFPPGPYAVSPGQPGAYPPPGGQPGPVPGAAAEPSGSSVLARRFGAANITHDGRLTRDQAATGMPLVAQNFDAIDIDRKGYVTLPEVRAFAVQRRAERGQAAQSSAQ
jgi:hypothetical protein